MAEHAQVILSLDGSDQERINRYIRGILPIVRRCGNEGFCFEFTRADLDHLGFCGNECVEPGEEQRFLLGSLAVFGEVMVRQLGCCWAEMTDGLSRDYVLCHPSFPTPVILKCIHEYACSQFEDLASEDRIFMDERSLAEWKTGVGWVDDSVACVASAYESLSQRIQAFEQRGFLRTELRLWRSERPFSLAINGFPDPDI